jgi:hypothetical protein
MLGDETALTICVKLCLWLNFISLLSFTKDKDDAEPSGTIDLKSAPFCATLRAVLASEVTNGERTGTVLYPAIAR